MASVIGAPRKTINLCIQFSNTWISSPALITLQTPGREAKRIAAGQFKGYGYG